MAVDGDKKHLVIAVDNFIIYLIIPYFVFLLCSYNLYFYKFLHYPAYIFYFLI